METLPEERIIQIIARHRRAAAVRDEATEHPERNRRLAHERVLNELPQFLTRVSSALLELNDRIADANLSIRLKSAEHTPAAEAIYILSVTPTDIDEYELMISVDFTGKIAALLHNGSERKLIKQSS